MIVYVESNFVLELAFLQEGSENTNAIIEIAEAGRIRLVLPAYCAGEPYERLVRRARDRKALREKLAAEIRELSPSKPYGDLAEASRELTSILARSADQEKRRLETVLLRLLAVAEVIPLDSSILKAAIELQPKFALSPQDAIVFASVQTHLGSVPQDQPKLFLTKNSKDFLTPDIQERLDEMNCRVLVHFEDAVGYLRSTLGSSG
jgi:predicted nucleic acid-binding protein